MKYLLLFLVSFFSFSQQNEAVDFIKLKAEVAPNEVDKSISGNCLFEFKVKKETSKYYGQSMIKAVIEDKNGEQCKLTIFPDKWSMVLKKIKSVITK
mgnify:CR=1 FL=1